MANRPKNKTLRDITGTTRPAPDMLEVPALADVPFPVAWLGNNPHAIAEWNRLAPILVTLKLLAEGDLSLFANYCALHGRIVEVWEAGAIPPASMLQNLISLGSAFGLAPGWRSKVKPLGNNEAETNPFAKHKQGSSAQKPGTH